MFENLKLSLSGYHSMVTMQADSWMQKFRKDERAEADVGFIADFIGLIVCAIFAIYLLPVVIDAISTTNYSNWTFTGAEGAKVLYGLLPFIFIIGVMLFFVIRLIGKAWNK